MSRRHVCLLLEGTYPYTRGGVGTWAHDLITHSPEFDFTLVAITDQPKTVKDYHYQLPPNVCKVITVNLQEPLDTRRSVWPSSKKKFLELVQGAAEGLARKDFSLIPELIRQWDHHSRRGENLLTPALLWDILQQGYELSAQEDSLAHFVWTWDALLRMLAKILQTPLPKADIYHSASTGYAGLLGALGKARHGGSFVLTEHGLYLQERQIEIAFHKILQGCQRSLVEQFFEYASRWSYEMADVITSLCEAIKIRQMDYGAALEKLRVIPNGIAAEQFSSIPRQAHSGFHIGLVGRVVPIKDVKLLILATKALVGRVQGLRVFIMGPQDDPEYSQECQQLVKSLRLESVLTFTGHQDAAECYSKLDLVVLCSLKEVQPLVLLEAMAAGIPVIATRSGGVPELVGEIGLVIPPRDLQALIMAIDQVAGNPRLRERMIQQGQQRVKAKYHIYTMIQQYHDLYQLTQKQGAVWLASV